MGLTMTQKLLAKACGKKEVNVNELINAKLDMVLGNDITAPVAIDQFEKAGFDKVFNRNKISLVMDHFTPNKDVKTANLVKKTREFAKKYKIKNYFDGANIGVEHVLLPELGLLNSGDVIIGADSHTCTYGALGCFSTGVGSTDMAAAMATGECWFKVPSAIKFELKGKLNKYISGKDVILYIIGKIGVDGALYKSMEFTGEGLKSLNIDDRFTISNMAIEAGAKNGIFEVDDITKKYLKKKNKKDIRALKPSKDAKYDKVYEIDLSKIPLTVAMPHLPSNTKPVKEINGIKIDQVVIGSCTNGRLSDLKIAAKIFKGEKVAKDVRVIIIPATQTIYKEALKKGYIETFMESGCIVSYPTCGPCLGGYMGILADNERAVSTTNRNFIGRMGAKTSEIYLASPAVAAASGIKGEIAEPKIK